MEQVGAWIVAAGLYMTELVDVSNVSPALFVTGTLFIILIGSLLSIGVVRLFQLRKRQGILYIALSVVTFAGLIVVMETWFA